MADTTYFLGMESSCDETAAAVVAVTDGRATVLSSIVASQIETHRLFGGVVPEIASRAHVEAISRITYRALEEASLTPRDLTAVGVTAYPGLIGALLVGVNFAKGLAAAHDLPLVPIDHIKAHIAAAYLTEGDAPPPCAPFVALAASGGHTSLYFAEDPLHFSVIGRTRDDAIGEAFDKIGRMIGIPYPAGAGFDRLAAEGFCRATGLSDVGEAYLAFPRSEAARDAAYRLPSPAMHDGTLDFSFSGLKTAAINLLHHAEQTGVPLDRSILAAAYTYTAVEAVVRQAGEALSRHTGAPFVVAGGVAANSHLRRRLADLCKKHGVALHIPPLSLCGDNGAMVAMATYFAFDAGIRADDRLNASAADGVGM